MAAIYVYEPKEHVQVTPVSELEIIHGFGRRVNPCVYNLNGKKVRPIIEEFETGGVYDRIKISWYQRSVLTPVGNWKVVIS